MTPLHPRRTVSALAAGLLAALFASVLAVGAAPAARADVKAPEVAQELRDDPLYTAPAVSGELSPQEEDAVRTELEQVSTPVYIAYVPDPQFDGEAELEPFAEQLASSLDGPATVLTFDGSSYYGGSTVIGDRAEAAAERAAKANDPDVTGFFTDFPRQVQSVVEGGGEPATTSPTSGSGGFPWTGLFLAILVVGGVIFYGVSRQRRKQREAEQLEEVRHAADEDVTRLGEDITALDLDIGGKQVDGDTRADYEHALDSYDTAKRRVDAAQRPEDLRGVSTAVEDGRFAMTCVRARLAGEPLPERRAPCFFNPQHGPSVTDKEWTPPGGTARDVPVCAADAERLAHGEEPEAREVVVDGQRRPYWEAGPGYAPWFGGYYGGFGMGGMLPGLLMGTMLGGSLGGFGMGGHGDVGGDFGGGGGDFGGGFGGGGGDFGGFGGGGGDFGGGF